MAIWAPPFFFPDQACSFSPEPSSCSFSSPAAIFSISAQISSLPCLLAAENGMITSSFSIPKPFLMSFTCFWIWLRLILSSFVAMITGRKPL